MQTPPRLSICWKSHSPTLNLVSNGTALVIPVGLLATFSEPEGESLGFHTKAFEIRKGERLG